MKTGIITLPPEANYGGILQAYALNHILRGMGHEAEVIYIRKSWANVHPLWRMPKIWLSRFVGKYIFKNYSLPVLYERHAEEIWGTLTQHTFAFVKKYIPYRVYDGYNSIGKSDYDAYVVGSDQIWRPMYFSGDVTDAFLRFAEGWDVKRIAYAASFGVDQWEYTPEKATECARLAKLFDGISVREASAVNLCREHLGVEACHVVDPTLLLNREDYESLVEDAESPHKGELLNYILDWDSDKCQMAERLEQITGKQSFQANSRFEDWSAPVKERIQPSVESWLQGFRDADMVITDSFHACVFSIIFNKPFYVVGNKERGLTRFISLLSMFGLESRLISSPKDIGTTPDIDWAKVNARREELKNSALAFLSSHI